MIFKTKELEEQERKQLQKFSDLMSNGIIPEATDGYGQLGFIRGVIFERKELIKEFEERVNNIEIEYPDDDGEPFNLSAEQFRDEIKQQLQLLKNEDRK